MAASAPLEEITLYRGSDWIISMPATISVDGSTVNYESVGKLQFQYRALGSTATPTRWDTDDGASRWDSSANAFLVPDDDALLSGSGVTEYEYDIHYLDASSNPKWMGGGVIRVYDTKTGAGV